MPRIQVSVLDLVNDESFVVGEYESVQMSGTWLRDVDGHTILWLNEITSQWVVHDEPGQREWPDFVVEAA